MNRWIFVFLVIASSGASVAVTNLDTPYIYGTPTGCLVQLKEALKASEHVRWNGDCNGEFASGSGVLTVLDNNGKTISSLRMTMEKGLQAGNAVPVPNSRVYQVSESGSKRVVQSAGSCNSNLRYLSGRIPDFSDQEISNLRKMLLETDIRQIIGAAKQQGYGPSQAVDAALQQAKENDRVARQGAECASDVDAWGTSDEAFYQRISSGRISRNINCRSSIKNSCLCAGIVNKMTAAGSRAIAAEIQCFAKNGQW